VTRLTAKTPEDVLAAVPVVLGFEPSSSVVMLTFGGIENFHARVDLPPPWSSGEMDSVVEQLREPASRHGVESVVFVLYTDDDLLARRLHRRLEGAFRRSGIRVVEALRADGSRWWFCPGRPGAPREGTRYDAAAHRFRAQSVLEGRVIHGSRDELVAMLRPIPGVQRVRDAIADVGRVPVAAVPDLVADALPHGRFDDETLASLLVSMADLAVRDAVWAGFEAGTADAQVELWTDAVQRSPAPYAADSAAVLALAAWLAGHGALAWCAVDRSQEDEPENSLAALVGDLLTDAVPPSAWGRWNDAADEDECG
jgi:hypothetical protein